MIKLTYLPLFITTIFRGMPGVWKSQHRLLLCWLIVMQAVYPGGCPSQTDACNPESPGLSQGFPG
jgi:hypothetical protein